MQLTQKEITAKWFENLRDDICIAFEKIELEYAQVQNLKPKIFERKIWNREGGGGGVISVMRGNVFEKVGVNISTVFGKFSPEFRTQIPGTDEQGNFYATGISIVAHMHSPLIPAVHMNTRYIETTKSWFGGGCDLTPTFADDDESQIFHQHLKSVCNSHNPSYYEKFKEECDKYFYLKHRNESRGIGGIFYDYLNTNHFDNDFIFTKDVGIAFKDVYLPIVKNKMFLSWSDEQKELQLIKRARYVEFNLLYDRGIKFGLMTGGNIEAMFMSLPPTVKWL